MDSGWRAASIALLALLLVEKTRLHVLMQRVDDVGLRSGVRFAVMALFFSGLSFAGYVARRLLGPDHGYLVTGLVGGLVSSTNVTFTFSRTSRSDVAAERALAGRRC